MLAVSTLLAAVVYADEAEDFKLEFPDQCQDKAVDCFTDPTCKELFHDGVESAFATSGLKGCAGNPTCSDMLECVKDNADTSNVSCFEEVFSCMLSEDCIDFLNTYDTSGDATECGKIDECSALLRCIAKEDVSCGEKDEDACNKEYTCDFDDQTKACYQNACALDTMNCMLDKDCWTAMMNVNDAMDNQDKDEAKVRAEGMKNALFKKIMECVLPELCKAEASACMGDEECMRMMLECANDDCDDDAHDEKCLANAACKAAKECHDAHDDSMYKVYWNVQICCISEQECKDSEGPLAKALGVKEDDVDVKCEKVAPTSTTNRRRAEIKEGTFKAKYTVLVEKEDDATKLKDDLAKQETQDKYKQEMENAGSKVESLQAEEATIDEPKDDKNFVDDVKDKIKDTVNKLSAGAIAGIVVGVVVFIVGLLVVVCFCCKCKLRWS